MYFFLATSVKALNSTSWEKTKGWVGKKKKVFLTTPVSKRFYSLHIHTNNGPTVCTTICLFRQRDGCRSHRGIALEVTRLAIDGSHTTALYYVDHERISVRSFVLSFVRSVGRSVARSLVRSVGRSFQKRKFTIRWNKERPAGWWKEREQMVQARLARQALCVRCYVKWLLFSSPWSQKLSQVRVVGVTCAACVFPCLDKLKFPVCCLTI